MHTAPGNRAVTILPHCLTRALSGTRVASRVACFCSAGPSGVAWLTGQESPSDAAILVNSKYRHLRTLAGDLSVAATKALTPTSRSARNAERP